MYTPIQMPVILTDEYDYYFTYTEKIIPELMDFSIRTFEAVSNSVDVKTFDEIALSQGTIDLGFDFEEKWIGYGGFSETEYHFTWKLPFRNFGIQLKPGAFHLLTGIDASSMMDKFLPLKNVDLTFDEDTFFALTFEEAKTFLIEYVKGLTFELEPDRYTRLFDELADEPPTTTSDLYDYLNLSPRTCRRLFSKHYGISPKKVLTILRFQKSLQLLLSTDKPAINILEKINYFDQAHFIKDFKRHFGMTPRELVKRYRKK